MEGKEYRFRFVCQDFELEVSGDQKFVEKTLERFENKVMVKLRELVSMRESAPGSSPSPSSPSVEVVSATAKPEQPVRGDKSRHKRHRGRRSRKKRPRSLESSGARSSSSGTGQSAARQSKASSSSTQSSGAPGKRSSIRIDEKALREEMDQKRPRTHHDRIMLMGNHLERRAGISEFRAEDIERCYHLIKEVPPANIQQAFNHASRSGFLVQKHKGPVSVYKLSAKAKKYVDDGLRLI